MNRATKIIELPALTVDLLKANSVLIDNVFASLWREVGMRTILSRAGFTKRFGTPMSDVMFSLMLWLWLQKESIGMFARECLHLISKNLPPGLFSCAEGWRILSVSELNPAGGVSCP